MNHHDIKGYIRVVERVVPEVWSRDAAELARSPGFRH